MTTPSQVENLAKNPAKNLDEVLELFELTTGVDVESDFYVPRDEDGLRKLTKKLLRNRQFHAFLCGHVGSGKTTELIRLSKNKKINVLYFPLFISLNSLKIDNANLSHDALLLGIGLQLIEQTSAKQLNRNYTDELTQWGKTLINTFTKDQRIEADINAKAGVWLVYFKAMLKSRDQWKHEEKQLLEPKVLDLINILDRMAQELKNNTGRGLLVLIDDLEKGDSDAEKQMHQRLFSEYVNVLLQPDFNIVYTLPVYYRALPGKRIDNENIFAFSAVRIYELKDKALDVPPLNKQSQGYQLIEKFIQRRLDQSVQLFEEGVLDELMLIGGGLFRDTDSAIADAADYALDRDSETISMADAKKVFNNVKKGFQPAISGDDITLLGKILNNQEGWVKGVEPFLQSRAVVEYENGDVWLDVRYVLKAFLRSLLEVKPDNPSVIVD
jgi:hypothetical protein